MKEIIEFIGVIIIPVIAIIISIIVYRRSVVQTMVDYYVQGNSQEQKECRKKLYDMYENKNAMISYEELKELDEDGNLGKIISFYDAWAILQNQHYLPLKIFKGITGTTAVKIFYLLKPYIDERRKQITEIENLKLKNDEYAKDFENLIKKIEKKKYVNLI